MAYSSGGAGLINTPPKSITVKTPAPKSKPPKVTKGVKPPKSKAPRRGGGRTPKAPNWLAAMTPQQIVQQARNTISKAYGPSYTELGQQANQATAVNAKRAADNKYYQSWLDSQMKALQAHADSSHQQLAGLESQLTNEQQGLYAQQPGQLTAGADARAGNVSNNADSTTFGPSVLGQNQQSNMGLLNSAEQQATQGMESSNHQIGSARANDFAFMQNAETMRIADLNKALTAIGNARAKLTSSKTADIAKEIARLQGIEISKAQSNRDFQAASQKLALATASTNSLIASRAANTANQNARLKLDITKAQLAQMNSDRMFNLDKQKYGSAVAKDLYERQHGLGPYRVSQGRGGSGGSKPLTTSSQNTLYSEIDKVTGQVNQMISTYGLTPVQAWHMLRNGGYVNGPAGANGKPTRVHIMPVGNVQILNAAYNLRNGGGGLSPGDIKALEHMGLSHPDRRYHSSHSTGSAIGSVNTSGL